MGQSWDNHGTIMGQSWENHGKIIEKLLDSMEYKAILVETHGKIP